MSGDEDRTIQLSLGNSQLELEEEYWELKSAVLVEFFKEDDTRKNESTAIDWP